MEEREPIYTDNIALKAKSKHELYTLLTRSDGIYLPPESDTHYKYIRQIC